MSNISIKYVLNLFALGKRDFSVFVSGTSKAEKERALRRAADRAIEQQRQILEGYAA